MVEYMRSTVVFAVIVGNLILASLNIFFSVKAMDSNPHVYYRLLSSKEILSERNPNYFIKDILDKEIESPKELRNLDYNSLRLGLLITDAISFLFIITLIMSFWMAPNECCSDNEDIIAAFPLGSCNGKCLCCSEECTYFSPCCSNCPLCNVFSYAIRGILLVPFCVLCFTYLIFNACGKHVARMTAVIILILLNVILFIMSLVEGLDTYCILIAICAFISILCNLIAIILPNCKDCECFSYYVIEPELIDEQYEQVANPEEEAYPEQEDVAQEQFDKPGTPDNNEQNQGNNIDDRNSINNPYDAPTPISVKDSYDENNQEGAPNPSPQ